MSDVEAEDRTQGPTKQRLQQARERGQVAHSPEMTAAVGLLAATVLPGVRGADLAAASGASLRRFTLSLAAATLALGLLDVLLQHRRFSAMLRMTPDEQREDQRAMEGDPALRARRRRVARTLRTDPGEVLIGASL